MKTTLDHFPEFTRTVNTEGIILLKNNNNTLPISKNETISLFGRSQIDYYKSGTGSGGAVNVLYSINALEGLLNNGAVINESLLDIYKEFIQKNPFDNGNGSWASEPWHQKELLLTKDIVESAALKSKKALIFIGRTAGEDQDNHVGAGSYLLTKEEKVMIDLVSNIFEKTILIYNVGNIIDMSYLKNYGDKIDSILYAWQGGMEGGNALADILLGNVCPSGKLPDTIAWNLNDYPTTKNFGDSKMNFYEEDIYVGYRYFETFNKEAVLYPFGYGLSYSDFNIKCQDIEISENHIQFHFNVKNIGDYAGKEVVQLYVEAPQGKLGKPKVELKGFVKTNTISPSCTEHKTIEIPISSLASYDDSGITGHKSAYVLENGTYKFYFGPNSRDLMFASEYVIEKTYVVEQLEEAASPLKEFKRIKPITNKNGLFKISYEDVPTRKVNLEKRIIERLPDEYPIKEKNILLQDVRNKKYSINEFVSQLSLDELSLIVLGEGMSHPLVTPGTAAAFGGLYPELHKLGIPAVCASDGPSGIRMDTGHKATQMPIGTLLSSTWNEQLIEELYQFEGQELSLNNIDTLLGPGLNIHRHPLCGRNFEYFSEDPFLTGKMALACIKGLRKGGAEGTLKHFAANDQEFSRNNVDSIVSERALREIHLKGFEMAIKEGKATSIMTAYNPVNGHQAASNYDLNTTILRNEWGFEGIAMTDWWARMNHNVSPDTSEKERTVEMIRSQNDLYMVTPNFGAAISPQRKNILDAIESNDLTIGELQRSAINVLTFVVNAPAMNRPIQSIEIMDIKKNTDTPVEGSYTNQVNFYTLKNAKSWISLDEDGAYEIEVHMRSKLPELAQSACNLLVNNQIVTNIQLNGTDNKVISKIVTKINISAGIQTIDLEFIKPGLEIISVKFIKD